MTTTGWRPGAISSDGSSVRPRCGADAEHLEVVAGDDLRPQRARRALAAEPDRGDDRAHEAVERAVVVAEILVVGIRDAERATRARFTKHRYQPGRSRHAGERCERDALQHREHRGVEADAERQDGDDGEREGRILRERANRVADVAHLIVQELEPPRRPDTPRRFSGVARRCRTPSANPAGLRGDRRRRPSDRRRPSSDARGFLPGDRLRRDRVASTATTTA